MTCSGAAATVRYASPADDRMSQPEPPPGADPSMEDILASIRRILDDGETPAAPAGPAAQAPDDVFLLDQTMLIEEPAPMQAAIEDPPPTHLTDEPVHAADPQADYSHLDAGEPPAEPLLAASTAAAASASLGALVRVMGQRNMPVYRGGPSLEDMVREEIRPLVKSWLDENLAPMVERLVRNEIERVTRGQQ